jgi:2-polyprenyl-6-methoxyphenol hydroxylase-like FAD-dependent oxidoreductase
MKVGVIGCGMGGMAAAIALARCSHRVTIFEAFDAPKPLGSGLLLQPSGLAALRALGLEDAAREAGARVDYLDGRDETGRRILDLDYSVWRKGAHGVGIRRSALFDLLYAAVQAHPIDIITGTPISAIESFDPPVLKAEARGCAGWSGRTPGRRSIRGAPSGPIAPTGPTPSPGR